MIQIELAREDAWPATTDWQALANGAVRAAIGQTPHGDFLDKRVCIEISLRLTTDDEVQALNRDYRHKDTPTNVLSFPMVQPDLLDSLANTDDGEVLLGDIVLAHGVCQREAEERGISTEDHATHLIVHGVLHLLGYDHQGNAEAEAMEQIERDVLGALGLPDPYLVRED